MNKGLLMSVGLLIVLAAALVGVRNFFKPVASTTNDAATINANPELEISLESFEGFHHDAEILLEKLTVLKTGLESAIDTKNIRLLESTINNTYRIMDNVSVSRLPTIAPFEVCDEALSTLGVYAVASKTYYSNTDEMNVSEIDKMRNKFDNQFNQCQSIVNGKPVKTLYQDYQ